MDELQLHPSQSDSNLPMIVHLLGNEDFVDEFDYDAQMAMDFLGIKRSRLTQISGRELRVGRIRQDRYIRPVFRRKDLENYRNWTRSTATHQSSSQAIDQAVQKLEDQFDLFEKQTIPGMTATLSGFSRSILDYLRCWSASLTSKLKKQFSQTWKRMDQYHDILFRSFSEMKIDLEEIDSKQQATHERLAKVESLAAEMFTDLSRLKAKIDQLAEAQKQATSDLESRQIHQTQQSESLLTSVKTFHNEWAAQRESSNALSSSINERFRQVEEKLGLLIERKKEPHSPVNHVSNNQSVRARRLRRQQSLARQRMSRK